MPPACDIIGRVDEEGGVEALLLEVDEPCEVEVNDVVGSACVDEDGAPVPRIAPARQMVRHPRTTDFGALNILSEGLATTTP